ncbi:EAL domain-containing protein [Alkalihalophilus lindianensis]|uniref:EAL domain-containing protein n=1 Tax=Alkalihalophilus lindianensis TaxID=1630542 RepID=A0ABU3XAM6_9BACI|nr:EAL domain-containing protein [Alkalihalophilus lindianensis]MDV2684942.1 EAL domain-containing protein [Alkalihalophilus lindianensis]
MKRVETTMVFEQANSSFSELEQEYRSLFNQSPYMMIVVNATGHILRINHAGLCIWGVTETDALQKHLCSLFSLNVDDFLPHVLNGKVCTCEATINRGETRIQLRLVWIPSRINGEVVGAIIVGELNTPSDALSVDVNMYRLANEDPLTNLPNRRYFMHHLESELQRAKKQKQKLAVLFIDLDRFKYVNDTLGHLFGDRVLVKMAERLLAKLPNQSMIARMGGDEFVVLMSNICSKDEPLKLTEKLLKVIRESLVMDGYEFTLTGSIGIGLYPESGRDTEAILTSADAAMYRAKASGTNRVEFYDRRVNQEFYEYFHVENDLRKALDRGEFELYVQPQFHTTTGELCGEEVLVRWQHPTQGMIGPSKFISIAEETGLIVPIGEWVLREACKLKAKWIKAGFPKVPMSVNLSLKQFLQKNIVQTIEMILNETGLPPEYLDLEVTESVTVDLDRTLDVLNRLIQLGVRISLDDFGTGYSSLQYVGQLPIHELKIDQSFVKKIGDGKHGEAIISMIIHLGHSLQLKVIAEGVETKQQLAFLKNKGCDYVQGYYYSKPLTVDQYKQFLRV